MGFTMNMSMMRKHARVHQQIDMCWKSTRRLNTSPISSGVLRDLVDMYLLYLTLFERGMEEGRIVVTHSDSVLYIGILTHKASK